MMMMMSTDGLLYTRMMKKMIPSSTKRKVGNLLADLAVNSKARVLLYHDRRQLISGEKGAKVEIAWQSMRVVRTLGLVLEEEITTLNNDDDDETSHSLIRAIILSDNSFAIDVSALDQNLILEACQGQSLAFMSARELMVAGSEEAAMDAGRAHAMLSWHAKNLFCGSCGAKTVSVEAGAKRVCTKCRNRLYPRTDPVAIALVFSTNFPNNEERILLGRSKKFRPGMYTCLSGFVESVESAEDAVRREVFEESGISVGAVSIVATQPWPTGRAGACELMIGCFAQAESTDIILHDKELEDARWFSRDQVQAAYQNAVKYANIGATPPDGTIFLPGSYAIAHHLVKHWLENSSAAIKNIPTSAGLDVNNNGDLLPA